MIIQGTFVDKETFEGIPFGSIVLANNQTKGTTTDTDGNFSIEVPSSNTPIIFASLGYGQTNFDKASDLNFQTTAISMKNTSIPNVVVKGKKWLPYAMYGGGGLLLTLGLIKKNKTLVFSGVLLALAYTSYTMYQKYRYKLGK